MTTFLNTIFGNIAFDTVISEDILASSVITSNPIETGAEVNDHIYVNPKSYTLTAGVSDTPLAITTSDLFTSSGQVGESGGAGRRVTAWDIMNQLHEAGEPFIVTAGLETIPNMLVTSLTAPNDADVSGSLIFTATLTQVIIVDTEESQLTEAQLKDIQTKQKATSNKSKGKVSKEPKTQQSLILQGFRAMGWLN